MAAVLDTVRALFAPTTFTIDAETPADVVARETLLDRVMGAERRKKSSEKIRRGRLPAEGLALVGIEAAGREVEADAEEDIVAVECQRCMQRRAGEKPQSVVGHAAAT